MPEHIVIDLRTPADGWREVDLSLLEERRATVPSFPVGLLPQAWADWIADTAASAAAPADYVAQSVLAAVAAVCGGGVQLQVTAAWFEPMILWQALVGDPSAGKSAGLTSMRRLLWSLEDERVPAEGRNTPDTTRHRQLLLDNADLGAIVERVETNPQGIAVWRDMSSCWLPEAHRREERNVWLQAWSAEAVTVPHEVHSLPISILSTVQPDTLLEAAEGKDAAIASRFLYAWPGVQPYRPLAGAKAAGNERALYGLRRLSRLAGRPYEPFFLSVGAAGVEALDAMLARLHPQRLTTEGVEAAWLGKGPASIVRLAGALALLDWSMAGSSEQPAPLGREQIETSYRLWNEYFHPHAQAVFDLALPTDFQRRVRRAARWLRNSGETLVSREDIRRKALCQTVDAAQALSVVLELEQLGYLRQVRHEEKPRHRPAERWEINPALTAAARG
ncbi:MAG: DUF3987 domain-containing protein [Alphaproteobacteria bacterium]|nr:DUF3987 domain-containing protein [Alphaproteobacteria bacterium]MBV8407278.1 DUF3987 domain-containing protein [Alphaproteobacteria bacterium]